MTVYIVSFTYGGVLRVFASRENALAYKKTYEHSTCEDLLLQEKELVND